MGYLEDIKEKLDAGRFADALSVAKIALDDKERQRELSVRG